MLRSILYIILFFCSLVELHAIDQRLYNTSRIDTRINIDGKLDEAIWQQAEVASDFIALEPTPGAAAIQRSEVRILYDDEALYIGAFMHEVSRDSVLKELTERDRIGNSDWFGFVVDTYRDNLNGFEFIVTSAGVQFDAKLSTFGEDETWNAVWFSETRIEDNGWYCEMKIPYSAIRFPKQEIQDWNINIIRNIRRVRQKVFWNEIDPKVDGFLTQSGRMQGVENIVSPFRLSITPYLAASYQNNQNNDPGNQDIRSFAGGMDLKYGINDAFTLDLTLIPDFSQAQSDNTVLNLTQFEVRYNEQRQFFTEGTELFNKADLIYFRRVGRRPMLYWDVEDAAYDSNLTIIENPDRQQLLNAIKVSGRDKSGLGVGIFNAITGNTYASVKDEEGLEHSVLTDPLTNYNAVVLDQNLKNNSFFSVINTNVTRQGSFYNANVLGTQFKFMDKNNMYGVEGSGSWSKKYGDSEEVEIDNESGFTYDVGIGKYSGNFNFWLNNEVISDEYDRNDMGFITVTNLVSYESGMSYNIFDPWGNFNRGGSAIEVYYSQIYNSGAFSEFGIFHDMFLVTKAFNAFGYWMYFEPIQNHDYWETRNEGRYYLQPTNYNFGGWYSSDYRKVFAFDINANYRVWNSDRSRFNISFSPRVRVSDKMSFILDLGSYNRMNDIGYADQTSEEIILGKRDQNTVETIFNIKYTFTNRMGLNFRLRHYWSKVNYKEYYNLLEDGTLGNTDYSNFDEFGVDQNNINFNIFNIDMVYRWVFSPGSEINFIWKNVIQSNDVNVQLNYLQNLENTLQQDQINTFTLKVLYFLDYLWVKNLGSGRKLRHGMDFY